MLSTEDADTPAEELVYHVDTPTNGMVALKEAPEDGIYNFTQAHVNKGEVIFIHEGEDTGMDFLVFMYDHCRPLSQTDGVSTALFKRSTKNSNQKSN